MSGGLAQAYPSSLSDVLREIGRIAWSASTVEIAFHEIAAAVRLLGGMLQFGSETDAMPGSVIEPVCTNGVTWGTLRIHFDPALTRLETSSGCVRFIAQQIALLLHRLSLLDEMDALNRRLSVLRRRLDTRKAVHRARGIVAKARGISDSEALRIMKRQARSSRRSLLQLAQSLIGGFETPAFEPPVLRRLHPGQVTTQRVCERSVAYA